MLKTLLHDSCGPHQERAHQLTLLQYPLPSLRLCTSPICGIWTLFESTLRCRALSYLNFFFIGIGMVYNIYHFVIVDLPTRRAPVPQNIQSDHFRY